MQLARFAFSQLIPSLHELAQLSEAFLHNVVGPGKGCLDIFQAHKYT